MQTLIEFDTIIYHNNCPDGKGGLWTTHHYNKNNFEQIGICAGTDPENYNFTNKKIIFIDVSPTIEFILEQSTHASKITILDHHKSAYDKYYTEQDKLKNMTNLELVFDMTRSGCQIAWDYFFPEQPRPWFINIIGDQDLWLFELENSKELNCALEFNNMIELDILDKLYYWSKDQISDLANEGKNIIQIKNNYIIEQLKISEEWKMQINNITYKIQVGTAPLSMKSSFGNLLTTKKMSDDTIPDFSVIWNYCPSDDVWTISLRGHDSSPDLSVIASHFGGGGHPKASGFRLHKNPFNDLFIK
jgi:oligoribonuclease NrnB/cAMP/cGMP phosphodiesterase (DHH superfamily)